MTRYPRIQVTVRSTNPLALVAAVRDELRRARVESSEIRRFSNEALSQDDDGGVRRVCNAWVQVRKKR